jgi:hypothetical protein
MARKLVVEVVGDERSLLRSFQRSSAGAKVFGRDLDRTSRGALAATLRISGLSRALTFASAQFLGGAGVVIALKSIVSEASKVQEETEKTGIVFGRNARQVQSWAQTLSNSFGVSEAAALQASGVFGNMLRPLGFGEKAAAKMSERLVELAADMASFNNVSPAQVLEALQSGLAGQVRPLRQFGVFLSQARIGEEAVADGIAKTSKHLTTAQRVQAAYNIILKDTKLQQGDVARNTGSLSVATSKLRAAVADLEARLGKGLIPALTAYVNKAAAWLSSTANQERIQRELSDTVQAGLGVLKALIGVLQTVRSVTAPLVGLVGGLRNALLGLIAIKVASRLSGWVTGLADLAIGMKGAEGRAVALRLSLLRLAAIGTIAIAVEVLLNKDKIDRSLTNFLRSHRLGFLTGAEIKIPVDANVEDVEQIRARFAKLRGEHGLEVQALDRIIEKLRELGRTGSSVSSQMVADFRKWLQASQGLPVVPAAPTFAERLRQGGFTGATGRPSRPLTATQRNQFFDASIGRLQDLVQDQTSLQAQISALEKIAGLIQKRLAATKDVTRRLTLEGQLRDVFRQIKSDREQLAQNIKDAVQAGNQAIADALSLRLEQAQITGTLRDDLRIVALQQAAIKQRIASEGKSTDLLRQLFENRQQTNELLAQQRSARQFRVLGLGPTGEPIVPTVKRLQKELLTVSAAVKGTFLDTDKTKGLLNRIRKALKDGLGGMSADVRRTIQQLLGDVNRQLSQNTDNLKTKFRKANLTALLGGLGLTADQLRELQGRVSQLGPGGVTPGRGFSAFGFALPDLGGTDVSVNVYLDGKRIEPALTKTQQRRARRTNSQRRGRHPGHRLGLA